VAAPDPLCYPQAVTPATSKEISAAINTIEDAKYLAVALEQRQLAKIAPIVVHEVIEELLDDERRQSRPAKKARNNVSKASSDIPGWELGPGEVASKSGANAGSGEARREEYVNQLAEALASSLSLVTLDQ
jgi:hypothetical protein